MAKQERGEALATASGGEVLPLRGLLPGGEGLDRWRPSWPPFVGKEGSWPLVEEEGSSDFSRNH